MEDDLKKERKKGRRPLKQMEDDLKKNTEDDLQKNMEE